MKRVICTVVALVMVLALAACGGGNGPDAAVKKFSEASGQELDNDRMLLTK